MGGGEEAFDAGGDEEFFVVGGDDDGEREAGGIEALRTAHREQGGDREDGEIGEEGEGGQGEQPAGEEEGEMERGMHSA